MTASTSNLFLRRPGSRKLAAVLAGGLIVGVGATSTLASWNDSEFAAGSFTAGRFNLEGSTDNGQTFGEHAAVDQAGAIDFSIPVTNLSPGDITNGSFPVRLAAGTTHDATLRVTAATSTGQFQGVAVIVWESVTRDCDAPYDPDHLLSFMMNGASYAGVRPTLTKGATADQPGEPIHVCFQLIPGEDLPQGQTGTFTWRLQATSAAQ